MRGSATDEYRQRHYADFLIRFGVASVVAVQNGFGVESQRNCVIDQRPIDVAGLRHVWEDDRDGAEDDENDKIAQCDVLQADAARVEKRRWQAAEVDEGQVLHPSRWEHRQQYESNTTESV